MALVIGSRFKHFSFIFSGSNGIILSKICYFAEKHIPMTELKIPYLHEIVWENPSIINNRLQASGTVIDIAKINWKDFPHQPRVKVYLGYGDQHLWIQYLVSCDFVRAVCRKDQEPVWQDSCVEFFMKTGDLYRNFEFNSLGVCLSAIGPDRKARKSLDQESMAQILRFPSLSVGSLPSESVPSDWSLTVGLPLNLLGLTAGSHFFANFYKCGDETRVPHYISWSAIDTLLPDFHRPGFFAPVELLR